MFIRLVDEDGIEQFINIDHIMHISGVSSSDPTTYRSKIYFTDGSFILVPMAAIDIADMCAKTIKFKN